MNAVAKIKEASPATASVGDRLKLEELMARVKRENDALNKAWDRIGVHGEIKLDELAKFENLHDLWKRGGGPRLVARCDELAARCDNPGYLDDTGEPKRSEISKVLAALLGSFPTANVPEPKVFTWALLEDVLAEAPSWSELEATCRVIRRTKVFMPAIAEVLKILAEQSLKWSGWYQALDEVHFFVDEAESSIAELKASQTADGTHQ